MIRKLLCWLNVHEYRIVVDSQYDIIKFISPAPMQARYIGEGKDLKVELSQDYYSYAAVGKYKCKHCGKRL